MVYSTVPEQRVQVIRHLTLAPLAIDLLSAATVNETGSLPHQPRHAPGWIGGVGVAVAVGVLDGVGVTVGVLVSVGVGVIVGVLVSVGVDVIVGVLGSVGVCVIVGVRVWVGVAVGVSVGSGVRGGDQLLTMTGK